MRARPHKQSTEPGPTGPGRALHHPRQRPKRGRCAGDHGDVTPLVIVTPITVTVVMLVIQLGLFFHARTVLNAAAQDGARAAQTETGTQQDAHAASQQILAGSTGLLTNEHITVTRTPATATVTVSADVTSVVPFWQHRSTATASGPTETFRPEADR